jgi:hypothetical protein
MKTFKQFVEQTNNKQKDFEQSQKDSTGNSGSETFDSENVSNSVKERIREKERRQKADEIRAILASEQVRVDRKDYDDIGGTVRNPRAPRTGRRAPGVKQRTKAVRNPETGKVEQVPVIYKPQGPGSAPNRGKGKSVSDKFQEPTVPIGQGAGAQLTPKEKQRKAYEERKERERKERERKAGNTTSTNNTTSSDNLETQANRLLAREKPKTEEKPKRKYRDWIDPETGEKTTRERRDALRNKERGETQAEIKKRLRAEFIEKNGRNPNKKESIQITAMAIAAAKASS